MFSQACLKNSVRGGVYTSMHWGRHPPGRHPSLADGYCSGQYASYWNAFLCFLCFQGFTVHSGADPGFCQGVCIPACTGADTPWVDPPWADTRAASGQPRGRGQLLRPKVAKVAKPAICGQVQGPLQESTSFGVFNAQICILPHSRDSFSLIFEIQFNTQKLIKIVHYIEYSINLRCLYVLLPLQICIF